MKNKRGQGLSTNAIILIILGVVVLVILIMGFYMGWGTIAPWIKTNNVDTIVQQCEVACATNSVYDYCSAKRELKADGPKIKDVTCYYLSEMLLVYGIDKCSSVDCTKTVTLDLTDCPVGKTSQVINPTGDIVVHTPCT